MSYRFYRQMRTTNEKRQNYGALADAYRGGDEGVLENKIRVRQYRVGCTPDAWDDIARCVFRSWKRHRARQWAERLERRAKRD